MVNRESVPGKIKSVWKPNWTSFRSVSIAFSRIR